MEAKFGLITRDSKPSDTVSREHSDPMDVGTFRDCGDYPD